MADSPSNPVRILFVCTGNICRSPMAEAIMRHKIMQRGMASEIEVDGAGTGGWHVGEPADPRTIKTLAAHGVGFPSRARRVATADFDRFDYILAMDQSHYEELKSWPGCRPNKISLFLNWDEDSVDKEVGDPYYGGEDGFEKMYELIDRGTDAILEKLAQ